MKNGILILTFLMPLFASAAFEENARRYASAQEIINSLNMYVPLQANCLQISEESRSALGLSSPLSGNPISPAPNQATIQWISKCIASSMQLYTSQDGSAKLKQILGDEVFLKFTHNSPIVYVDHLNVTWGSLDTSLRQKIVSLFVYSFLGSDETILDYGLTTPEKIRTQLLGWLEQRGGLTISNSLQFLILNLSLRDEFLSY